MRTTTRHDSGDCRTGNADLFPVTQQRQYRHATVEHLTLASASASAVAAAVQTNTAVATCCPDNADVTSHCPPSFSHIDVTRNSHYNALDWTRGPLLIWFRCVPQPPLFRFRRVFIRTHSAKTQLSNTFDISYTFYLFWRKWRSRDMVTWTEHSHPDER